jgi:hypothetical protein
MEPGRVEIHSYLHSYREQGSQGIWIWGIAANYARVLYEAGISAVPIAVYYIHTRRALRCAALRCVALPRRSNWGIPRDGHGG